MTNTNSTLSTLTSLEREVLSNLISQLYVEQGFSDVGCIEIANELKKPINTIKGVIGSLTKKHIVYTENVSGIKGGDVIGLSTDFHCLHPRWCKDAEVDFISLEVEEEESEERFLENQGFNHLLDTEVNNIETTWLDDDDERKYQIFKQFLDSNCYKKGEPIKSYKNGLKVDKPGYMTNDLYNWEGRLVILTPGMPDSFAYRKSDFPLTTTLYTKTEIIEAVDAGKEVTCNGGGYKVVKQNEQYFIKSNSTKHIIGLSGEENTPFENELNGTDFVIQDPQPIVTNFGESIKQAQDSWVSDIVKHNPTFKAAAIKKHLLANNFTNVTYDDVYYSLQRVKTSRNSYYTELLNELKAAIATENDALCESRMLLLKRDLGFDDDTSFHDVETETISELLGRFN